MPKTTFSDASRYIYKNKSLYWNDTIDYIYSNDIIPFEDKLNKMI